MMATEADLILNHEVWTRLTKDVKQLDYIYRRVLMPGIDDSELDIVHFSPVCLRCKHYIFDEKDVYNHICNAFLDGIPPEIWNGENNHIKPYSGDHDIQYEPR